MKTYPEIGVQIGEILLPRPGIDLKKWAVIACDQFTSEPEYWQQVADTVGSAPSSLNLILPEVYLGTSEELARIQNSRKAMQSYVEGGLLTPYQGSILVERTTSGKTRHGLMLTLDLECYDFTPGSQSLIRATEGTILDRLPPRVRIREVATLEMPHILVLIDDPQRTVIEPLVAQKGSLPMLYDTDLMLGSGHVSGYAIQNPDLQAQIIHALRALADPRAFHTRYQVADDKGVLLFAMGDGNHSLATAKTVWEKLKPRVGIDHPARYALVEIENVHDSGLDFEPIHRAVFETHEDVLQALQTEFSTHLTLTPFKDPSAMIARVKQGTSSGQIFGLVTPQGSFTVQVDNPSSYLAVGTLQTFLDRWLKRGGAEKIDYVHGDDVIVRLGSQPGNAGFYLPVMDKNDLFKTVIVDGALPRKTFSMGEAIDKRFYLESRRIA
jgi:hypothetical protein